MGRWVFFLSFFASAFALAAEFDLVVKVPVGTPLSDKIYFTSDSFGCAWRADCLELAAIGDGNFRVRLNPPASQKNLEFKITRGDWAREASDPQGRAIANFKLELSKELAESVVSVVHWRDERPLGVTGDVRFYARFASSELGNERDVSVWLPPSYRTQPERRYPVIYMHDGQNVFNPVTSTNGVDWGVDETMTKLIANGEVPEAIVVAANCTEARTEEYDVTLKGRAYANFLIHRLKPFVDARYRTQPGPESTSTMGSSMGALISLALVWEHPEVFSRAAGVSMPAFYHDEMIARVLREDGLSSPQIKIYMDHGTWGGDAEYAPAAGRLFDQILKLGLSSSNLDYEVAPYADHNEADWSRRVAKPLRFLLNN